MIDIAFALATLLITLLFSGYFVYVKIHPENTPLKRMTNAKGRATYKPISTTTILLFSVCIAVAVSTYLVFAVHGLSRSELGSLLVVTATVVAIFITTALFLYHRMFGDKGTTRKSKND